MDNYHITETNLTAYLSNADSIDTIEHVEEWIDSNNISLTEIVDFLWKVIL